MEALIGFALIAAALAVIFTRVNADGQVVSRWNHSSSTDGITGAMVTGHGNRNQD